MIQSRTEPTLAEMLADPTLLAVLRRDGIDPQALRRFLVDMGRRLPRRAAERPALAA
ncbi:MAG TPA: hypothetical protein VEH84_15535 [Alphaproteobacteria bacterium]|nr:hypothetical protein [Alphaproteobacteria bacterium]